MRVNCHWCKDGKRKIVNHIKNTSHFEDCDKCNGNGNSPFRWDDLGEEQKKEILSIFSDISDGKIGDEYGFEKIMEVV
jgi:hypothetical protein